MSFIINSVSEAFPSQLVEVSKLQPLFTRLAGDIDIDEKRYFEIMVSVSEAFNNAIKHGNKFDNSKLVVLKAGISKKLLWCRITDQGLGFVHHDVPDPLEGDNILKESGRGVFLIKQLTTGSSFRNTKFGYQVDMLFTL